MLGTKNGFRAIFSSPAHLKMHPAPFAALTASSDSPNKIFFGGVKAKSFVQNTTAFLSLKTMQPALSAMFDVGGTKGSLETFLCSRFNLSKLLAELWALIRAYGPLGFFSIS